MPNSPDLLFSVITPSAGNRPRALALAIGSVLAAAERARRELGFDPARLEMLVGFDGVEGERPASTLGNLRFYTIPRPQGLESGFGNHVRHALMGAARGRYLLLLDDDNALAEGALTAWLPLVDGPDRANRADRAGAPELLIARIDTSRAFDVPLLPRPCPPGADPVQDAIRQGNIDPLCLCLSRELAYVRCRGWENEGGYESDFLNIRRYHRRARGVARIDDVVGVYDAGRGLDPQGLNPRQKKLA